MAKRTYLVRAEVELLVNLYCPDSDSFLNCCDPEGEMTDAEAVESAVTTAIRGCQCYVYGEDAPPASVTVDSVDIHIEGFEDE